MKQYIISLTAFLAVLANSCGTMKPVNSPDKAWSPHRSKCRIYQNINSKIMSEMSFWGSHRIEWHRDKTFANYKIGQEQLNNE